MPLTRALHGGCKAASEGGPAPGGGLGHRVGSSGAWAGGSTRCPRPTELVVFHVDVTFQSNGPAASEKAPPARARDELRPGSRGSSRLLSNASVWEQAAEESGSPHKPVA